MQTYTIGEASKKMGITAHTLRFYDKQGLLPLVERDHQGHRVFKESDLDWLRLIECFKQTGLPIKQIRQYLELCLLGDATLQTRLAYMCRHKETILQKRQELDQYLLTIDRKIRFYQDAVQQASHPAAITVSSKEMI